MMSARDFKARVAPASAPHEFAASSRYARVVQGLFTRFPALVAAAALQLVLFVLAPRDYAIVPAAAVVVGYAASAIAYFLAPRASEAYAAHVVGGRATAQLPSARGLVVFNLGVQFNHPLGALCPGGPETGRRFEAMNADLMRRRDELGLVAVNTWRGAGVDNASSMVVTYYFRDVESIHRFAHEDLHRATWDWYSRRGPSHIGVYHETFVVPPQSYETIYVNCAPVGLGRGSVRSDGIEGNDKWVNTLVSADTPLLRTQMGRLHRDTEESPSA